MDSEPAGHLRLLPRLSSWKLTDEDTVCCDSVVGMELFPDAPDDPESEAIIGGCLDTEGMGPTRGACWLIPALPFVFCFSLLFLRPVAESSDL